MHLPSWCDTCHHLPLLVLYNVYILYQMIHVNISEKTVFTFLRVNLRYYLGAEVKKEKKTHLKK